MHCDIIMCTEKRFVLAHERRQTLAATLKTDTRQKIIDSTLSLISTRDVNEISLQDIANAANITKGTLFYYYNSKELIFEDITIEYLNGLATRYYEWINNADKDTSFPRLAKYVLDSAQDTAKEARCIFTLSTRRCPTTNNFANCSAKNIVRGAK